VGCGWKRWSDEAGIERLRILQLAWQEHDTVFGKVMRGAVWQMQIDSGSSDLVLESRYSGEGRPAVEDTWLGMLWQWMSSSGMQIRLKGRAANVPCKGSQCDCDRELLSNLRGYPRKMAADGCSKFGVHNVSDLLERDGMKLRPEMCRGGEWSRTGHGKEWVELMREKLGATCSQESVGVHYPMPAASLCVGAFVGYKYQGTTAVGCVVRIGDVGKPGSPLARLW